MSHHESKTPPAVHVDRIMLHDLVNHLTIAIGNSDLLLLDAEMDPALLATVTEIRDACRRAVDLVEGWRAHLSPDA